MEKDSEASTNQSMIFDRMLSVALIKIVLILVAFSKFLKNQFPPSSPKTYPKHSFNGLLSSENGPFKEGHKKAEIREKKLSTWTSPFREPTHMYMNAPAKFNSENPGFADKIDRKLHFFF